MPKVFKLIIAAATGFIAGILVAPKSGKQTRRDIKNKASELKDKATDEAGKLRGVAEEGVDAAKHGAEIVAGEVAEFGKSAKGAASRIAGEAVELGDEAKDRAARVAGDAKRTAKRFTADAKKKLK